MARVISTARTLGPARPAAPRLRAVENVPTGVLVTAALTGDVADHADFNPGTGPYGFSTWMRWYSGQTQRAIAGKMTVAGFPIATGWIIVRQTNGTIVFYQSDGTGAVWDSVTVPETTVYSLRGHVLLHAERDSSLNRILLYLNTQLVGSSVIAQGGSIDNAVPLSLVRNLYAAGMRGCRNDAVWRKGAPFTPAERAAQFFDGIVPANPGGGVVQYRWGMREGAGLVAASSPAGRDCALSAASWTPETRCIGRPAA